MLKENIELLNESDVLLATYPGSGTTWLANILAELNLPYIDGYTERLVNNTGVESVVVRVDSRERTPSLAKLRGQASRELKGRIIKTHFWPDRFDSAPLKKAILLVRDGRDSVLSYYHWRLSFSEEGENGSFSEFLRRPGFNGVAPLDDWARTIDLWCNCERLESLCLLKFEECKNAPESQVARLLEFLGVCRSQAEIDRAIRCSTFEAMRKAEEVAVEKNSDLGGGFIMRNGSVGQWRSNFSSSDLTLVRGFPAQMLRQLGYEPPLS